MRTHGTVSCYNHGGCRCDDCKRAAREARRGRYRDDGDLTLVADRPVAQGLRVIDVNAHHPARARWAALIAKLEVDA